MTSESLTARYLRLRLTKSQDWRMAIRRFEVTTSPGERTAITSLGHTPDHPPSLMLDGSLSTFYWSKDWAKTGQWVMLDLGVTQQVSRVDMYLGQPDGGFTPPDGLLEASTDTKNWTTLTHYTRGPELHYHPAPGLLLQYHINSPKIQSDGYNLLRLIAHNDSDNRDDPDHRVQRLVCCRRITLNVPVQHSPTSTPISVRTRVTPVAGHRQGRRWWICVNTTNPTNATFTCVPENTASFDGTWSITFTVELNHTVTGTPTITEDADPATGEFTTRTGHVPLNMLNSTP